MQIENIFSCWQCLISALILLVIANGTPVVLQKILGDRFIWPVDFGLFFFDNRPVFGTSKTWRGVLSSLCVTSLIAPLFGLTVLNGALFSLFVMAGDLTASFVKRRLGYVESSRFRILDVFPESLLPVFLLRGVLQLTVFEGFLTVVLFFIFEVILSPVLFRLHIRKRPY